MTPNFSNMSRDELFDCSEEIFDSVDLLNHIRSILIANCKHDSVLGKLNIKYDESRDVATNLITILEELIFITEGKDMKALSDEVWRLRKEKKHLGANLRAVLRSYKLLDN